MKVRCMGIPLLEAAMTEAGLQAVETCVSFRHNTVTQFIATRTIMDLSLAADRRPGSRVSKQWWEQDGLDVEGMRTVDWEAERTEGGGGGRMGRRRRKNKSVG